MAIIPHTKKRWAEGAIVYQVYPRSFYDSNADGIGDIPGVTQKLDYLKSFGVNAIWLSPFYPSPMADFGYDVSDYKDVDPIFGSLNDMDDLIRDAHGKDIKIMVDLVPNHSSDDHEWFLQSRQSKEGAYADWYIWRDPSGYDENDQPIAPNNWLDFLTGKSAWQWEPMRQQFYLHTFDVRQPDLNWGNPEVRDAIKDAMRFWLDRGVDGFRVDAVRYMGKDPTFQDDPINPQWKEGMPNYDSILHKNSQGWPQFYLYLNEMAEVLKEEKYLAKQRFMVTESYLETHDRAEEYLVFYQGMDPEVAAPFNFEGVDLPWQAQPWKDFLTKFHTILDEFSPLCVTSYAFGNHDKARVVSRVGEQASRAVAVMQLTLPGMAFIYNGEEIGMKDGEIPPHLVQDPGAKDVGNRDPQRTPLQWSAGKNAGFSEAETTWLPIADGFETTNVESESHEKGSFLSLYRQLGKLRNDSEILRYGKMSVVESDNEHVLGYLRTYEEKQIFVLINFSDKETAASLPDGLKLGSVLISSVLDAPQPRGDSSVHLRANEAVVFAVES